MSDKSDIHISDSFKLTICLEDQEDSGSPTEFAAWVFFCGGHECVGRKYFLQLVKGDALHAEGLVDGAEANVPEVSPFWL